MGQQVPIDLNKRLNELQSAFFELATASAKFSINNIQKSIEDYQKELNESINNSGCPY